MLDGNKIISVKLLGDSAYFVNGNTTVPKENVLSSSIEQWISEGNIPEPEFTDEELIDRELQAKDSEATLYLKDTDWVNDYKLRHDIGLELIPESSSKWEVINKREIYISFLKGL